VLDETNPAQGALGSAEKRLAATSRDGELVEGEVNERVVGLGWIRDVVADWRDHSEAVGYLDWLGQREEDARQSD